MPVSVCAPRTRGIGNLRRVCKYSCYTIDLGFGPLIKNKDKDKDKEDSSWASGTLRVHVPYNIQKIKTARRRRRASGGLGFFLIGKDSVVLYSTRK